MSGSEEITYRHALSRYIPSFATKIFPTGWFSFCCRTWLAVVLALAAAFWLQLEAPASAAVTVMLLAQPLRGQVLSKAMYRMLATVVGAAVSIFLVALFPQERFLLLGGMSLWLCVCVAIGTLERDFRSYAAVLAGYTAVIIGIGAIDHPQDVFNIAISRTSAITIGIIAVATVNDFFNSPVAWKRLAQNLQEAANEINDIARSAVEGAPLPSDEELASMAARIIGMISDSSFAKTEMEDSRYRTAGAQSAMVGMLDILSCSRAIAHFLQERPQTVASPSDEFIAQLQDIFHTQHHILFTPPTSASSAPDEQIFIHLPLHTPQEAFLLERVQRILQQTLWVTNGIDTLIRGRKAIYTSPPTRIIRHQDVFAVFMNSFRTLVGFSIASIVCVLSGIPQTTATLSQVSVMLTQAGLNPNPLALGYGSLFGISMTIFSAMLINYFVLPYGNSMAYLAFALLPQVFLACLLLLNPKTSLIGFNFGVFFFAILAIDNIQQYDPTAFLDRSVYYFFASIIIFISIVLLFPPSAKRRRFRIAFSIVADLKKQFLNKGEQEGPALISRQYDRLAQTLLWNSKRAQTPITHVVFSRLMSLGDLNGALARARRYLDRARTIAPIYPEVNIAISTLVLHRSTYSIATILSCCRQLVALLEPLPEHEQEIVTGAVSALYQVAYLIMANKAALRHYGIAIEQGED